MVGVIKYIYKISYEYIRIFIRVIFLTRIYSDIRSYQNPYECHTLIQKCLGNIEVRYCEKYCQKLWRNPVGHV